MLPHINFCTKYIESGLDTVRSQLTAHTPVFGIVRFKESHQNWYSTASYEHLQCQGAVKKLTDQLYDLQEIKTNIDAKVIYILMDL